METVPPSADEAPVMVKVVLSSSESISVSLLRTSMNTSVRSAPAARVSLTAFGSSLTPVIVTVTVSWTSSPFPSETV